MVSGLAKLQMSEKPVTHSPLTTDHSHFRFTKNTLIMKKIFIYTIAAIGVFSCNKKEDHVFDKSIDERLNETLAADQKALTGAQYGWKGFIYPSGVKGGGV